MPAKLYLRDILKRNTFFGGNSAGEKQNRNRGTGHSKFGYFYTLAAWDINLQTEDNLEEHYNTLSKLV